MYLEGLLPEVYPRVGGGNRRVKTWRSNALGLSPRGRGKLGDERAGLHIIGSIPAWAGETIPSVSAAAGGPVYPRVGGGNPPLANTRAGRNGLSPRGRGKLRQIFAHIDDEGSIPAWAGETDICARICHLPGVYPRVGGGNMQAWLAAYTWVGLSPRGRGKPA